MNGSAPGDDKPSAGEPWSARMNVATLRRATPVRMWGGNGSGMPCDFCRVLVSASDVEYEVEAQLDGATIILHFHPRCHDAWVAGQEPGEARTIALERA